MLENRQPEKIKTVLVESTVSADISVSYPILVWLLRDVQATGTDLELGLKLKHADTFESMEKAFAEAKLALVFEHTCNVIYILGPKARSPLSRIDVAHQARRGVDACRVDGEGARDLGAHSIPSPTYHRSICLQTRAAACECVMFEPNMYFPWAAVCRIHAARYHSAKRSGVSNAPRQVSL